MKVLFITRKFPPSVGGLETAAFGLYEALAESDDVRLVKWGGSNIALPLVYPWLFIKGLWFAWTDKPDIIYLQEGVMAPLGALVKLLSGRPAIITIHGLDITYQNFLYRLLTKASLPRLDHIVVDSNWADDKVHERYPALITKLIELGTNDNIKMSGSRAEIINELVTLIDRTPEALAKRQILLTTGRLIPRKGVKWFLESVLPEIIKKKPTVLYIIAGQGPEAEKIQQVIKDHKLKPNVLLLGKVDQNLRNLLYNVADLFIMPNVPVENDGEGFGLVALEASSCGTPVLAANLEGISNAVVDGKTGLLINSQDAKKWQKTIINELKKPRLNRAKVRQITLEHYSWKRVADDYSQLFRKICKKM